MIGSTNGLLALGTGWLGKDQVFTLFLEGEIQAKELKQLSEELFRLAQRGHRNVVLDFTDVSHLDYRGIKSLWDRAEIFRKVGGDVRLCGLSPYLAAILRAAGAHGAFEMHRSVQEARASFELGRESAA